MRHTYYLIFAVCLASAVFGLSSCSKSGRIDSGETSSAPASTAPSEETASAAPVTSESPTAPQTLLTTASETFSETESVASKPSESESSEITSSEKRAETLARLTESSKKNSEPSSESPKPTAAITETEETEVYIDGEEMEFVDDEETEEVEDGSESLEAEYEDLPVGQYQGYYPPPLPPAPAVTDPEVGFPSQTESTTERTGSVTNEKGDILLPEVP